MELEKKYIYQVYQCGSFSKAAEALFITQPALSIAIKKSGAGNRCCHFQPQPKAAHSHEHRRTVSAAHQKGNAAGAAAQAAD